MYAMKQTSTTRKPTTSEPDEASKLTRASFVKAHYRVGGKEATRGQWQAAVKKRVLRQG